nr:helix-turn-helix domain-containing protein [Listeria floridensis]
MNEDGKQFHLPSFLTQELIASLCKTKVYQVAKEYKILKAQGIMKVESRRVTITDFDKLQQRAEFLKISAGVQKQVL